MQWCQQKQRIYLLKSEISFKKLHPVTKIANHRILNMWSMVNKLTGKMWVFGVKNEEDKTRLVKLKWSDQNIS